MVERTNAWTNGYGKLRSCAGRRAAGGGRWAVGGGRWAVGVDFSLFLAATFVVVRMLIDKARARYRWPSRPTTHCLR